MEHRAVGKRCAVVFDHLWLPISNTTALTILVRMGFRVIDVDCIALARQCMGTSLYRRGARLLEAPAVVDCSSFVKWLYAQRGIWLPRRSIQQRAFGEVVHSKQCIAGDLIFVSGCIDYYDDDPTDGVGHVGMATGDGTVIHAANSTANVVETQLEAFMSGGKFRGMRRYVPQGVEVVTLETPTEREVEVADDIRWVVLQSL